MLVCVCMYMFICCTCYECGVYACVFVFYVHVRCVCICEVFADMCIIICACTRMCLACTLHIHVECNVCYMCMYLCCVCVVCPCMPLCPRNLFSASDERLSQAKASSSTRLVGTSLRTSQGPLHLGKLPLGILNLYLLAASVLTAIPTRVKSLHHC